jgi:tyrosinase
MSKAKSPVTRRTFLKTSVAAAAGAASIPLSSNAAARSIIFPTQTAKYRRHNVTSTQGQRALMSYANAISEMLKLPASHPQNWFRNAFTHLMDCPHGNWWFYVWHRGYLGFFEETIRKYSNDDTFAIPYWDWTTLPEIPLSMFQGSLTPTDISFEPYTRNLAVFTSFIKQPLEAYWNTLSPAQRAQLNVRGYTSFDLMWNDVTGYVPNEDPNEPGFGVSGNMAYAITCGARYLTSDNRQLDDKTQFDVSPGIVCSGLRPIHFYNPDNVLSFTSAKTTSHNAKPEGPFSVLEGFPHNKVHNYIGGVGPLDPGPYGNMTNFLSPVDPIFFLHHSNMDRLWDVWTRKQQRNGQPWLPPQPELDQLSIEPFLFYINGGGQPVSPSVAGDYLNMSRFNYDYEPGFGEKECPDLVSETRSRVRGLVRANTAALTVPTDVIRKHLATPAAATLFAEVTIPHPAPGSPREFDVLVNAPAGVTEVGADSPYYAGTIAFFGSMAHAHGTAATFVVPLPKSPQAFQGVAAVNARVNIRIVPAHGRGKAPVLRALTIKSL